MNPAFEGGRIAPRKDRALRVLAPATAEIVAAVPPLGNAAAGP